VRDDNRKIIIFKGYAHLIPAEDEDELIKSGMILDLRKKTPLKRLSDLSFPIGDPP